jgi:hypothetical protein
MAWFVGFELALGCACACSLGVLCSQPRDAVPGIVHAAQVAAWAFSAAIMLCLGLLDCVALGGARGRRPRMRIHVGFVLQPFDVASSLRGG